MSQFPTGSRASERATFAATVPAYLDARPPIADAIFADRPILACGIFRRCFSGSSGSRAARLPRSARRISIPQLWLSGLSPSSPSGC